MSDLLSRLTGMRFGQQGQEKRSIAGIKPGRTVKATVLESQGGMAKVRIAGEEFQAKAETPLTPGQVVNLKADAVGEQTVFSVISEAASKGGGLRQALAEMASANLRLISDINTVMDQKEDRLPPQAEQSRQALTQLKEAVNQAVLDEKAVANGPDGIKQSIRATGQNWEAMAAKSAPGQAPPTSVKTLARVLAASLGRDLSALLPGDGRASNLKSLLEAAKGLERWAEANQKLNLEMLPRQEMLLISLPLLMGEQISRAEVLLEMAGKGSNLEGQGTRVVFLLNLTNLGELLVEARVHGSNLSAELVTTDSHKAAFLRQELPQLEEALQALGFNCTLGVAVRSAQDLVQDSPMASLMRSGGDYLSVLV